jgi:hypothetical protein
MRLRIPVLLTVVLLATACLDALDVPDGRFGNIIVSTFEAGSENYTFRAEAAFLDRTDATYTTLTVDTCIVTGFNPNDTGISGGSNLIRAGEFLFTNIAGRTDTLSLIPGLAVPYYRTTLIDGVPFVPGDTLQVTVPGASPGFPAASIFVRTAEPFTHDPVGVPAVNESQPIAWTPAPAAGSAMTMSLRYNNNFSIDTLPNEQVFCSFVDDGAASVPDRYLAGWRGALLNSRSTRFVRVRSRQTDVDARTRIALISTFARPIGTILR